MVSITVVSTAPYARSVAESSRWDRLWERESRQQRLRENSLPEKISQNSFSRCLRRTWLASRPVPAAGKFKFAPKGAAQRAHREIRIARSRPCAITLCRLTYPYMSTPRCVYPYYQMAQSGAAVCRPPSKSAPQCEGTSARGTSTPLSSRRNITVCRAPISSRPDHGPPSLFPRRDGGGGAATLQV